MTVSSPSSVESDAAIVDESDPLFAIFDSLPATGKAEEAVSVNSEPRSELREAKARKDTSILEVCSDWTCNSAQPEFHGAKMMKKNDSTKYDRLDITPQNCYKEILSI
jgi:hypothetical protein